MAFRLAAQTAWTRRSASGVEFATPEEESALISIRRISLGGGFRYLMESVAAGDGAADRSSPLARYYAQSGTPPGRFLGSGLADLDHGSGIAHGTQVTEEHLRLMLVALADPVTGEPVGGAPQAPGGAVPVAGFDLCFSPSKSVSVAWALADADTKVVIYNCHLEAINYVLAYGEREVFHSRSGKNGIVDEDVTGIVAAAFTHWSSRADDPQLHDHVVVWNRAKSVTDGKWRTLDSKAIFKQTTTLSELHQGVLSDLLTARLGVGWEARRRRHSAKPRYEITGVPETLMAEFSRRSEQIAGHTAKLREEFIAAHGRAATRVEDMRLHQVATVATRPDKAKHTLATLTGQWRDRAAKQIALDDQLAFVSALGNRNDLPLLRSDDLGDPILADAAEAVVMTVAERHSTYGRHNLLAEAHRVLHGVRFASPDDRVAIAERVTDFAVAKSLRLTPPELCHVPDNFRRADGSSRLRPRTHVVYTTKMILEAEARLLDAARQVSGPRVSEIVATATVVGDLPARAHELSTDQKLAIEKIAISGRVVDVLVGPAGTGKTTAMAGLRAVWEAAHGSRSVIGLAPSAAAAQALSEELGIETENTAKWLTDWRRVPELAAVRRRLEVNLARHPHPNSAGAAKLRAKLRTVEQTIAKSRLSRGQLVIVDEASLASTFVLDELVSAARQAGAKLLLSGDWAQLGSIDAGGAFSLLVKDRGDLVPQLSDVRRFMASWERDASLDLRLGDHAVIDAYERHGRIAAGSRTEMIAAIYSAWRADVDAGKSSLMIGADAGTVAELNRLARADRVTTGAVSEDGVRIADGQIAGVGDEVFTRQNDRRLAAGSGWVKNGDRWVVTAAHADGSMAVRSVSGGAGLTLPASYVAMHVEPAYATTAFRAQGRTVDTAHAMVSPTTTREVLYVSTTRGRESNRLYVDVAYDPDPATGHDGAVMPQTARDVLGGVLSNEGRELSAHETLVRAQHESDDIATLAAEYEAIARVAEQDHWDAMIDRCGLGSHRASEIKRSDAYGPLVAALRRAEACGLDVEAGLRDLVAERTLVGVGDIASVLHHRVENWIGSVPSQKGGANLIAGIVPRANGVIDRDLTRAFAEREALIEQRAREAPSPAHRHLQLRRIGPSPVAEIDSCESPAALAL